MGAAFVSMGDRFPARSVAVFGSACSTRPELAAITLALEESLPREDLTILTDSLVAMATLFSLRRADFRSRFIATRAVSYYSRTL